jgi:hypothetical protein
MIGTVLETAEDRCEAGNSGVLRSRGDGCGAALEEPGKGGERFCGIFSDKTPTRKMGLLTQKQRQGKS